MLTRGPVEQALQIGFGEASGRRSRCVNNHTCTKLCVPIFKVQILHAHPTRQIILLMDRD